MALKSKAWAKIVLSLPKLCLIEHYFSLSLFVVYFLLSSILLLLQCFALHLLWYPQQSKASRHNEGQDQNPNLHSIGVTKACPTILESQSSYLQCRVIDCKLTPNPAKEQYHGPWDVLKVVPALVDVSMWDRHDCTEGKAHIVLRVPSMPEGRHGKDCQELPHRWFLALLNDALQVVMFRPNVHSVVPCLQEVACIRWCLSFPPVGTDDLVPFMTALFVLILRINNLIFWNLSSPVIAKAASNDSASLKEESWVVKVP